MKNRQSKRAHFQRTKLVLAVSAINSIALLGSSSFASAQSAGPLEEVIVTANKRAQSIQDVSASVSALSPDRLEDSQITNMEDLQVTVPGLTVGNDFAIAKIYLRGIGLNSSLPGMDPSVALHVDGAVVSSATQHFSSLFDVERLEILRGPQGTLYGRNATGGSINVISAKPTDDFEAYTRFTVGNYQLLISESAVSGPLIGDVVQGRFALRREKRDGYGTHTGSGKDIDDSNKLALRAQLNFDITDSISNLLSFEYYEDEERSRTLKFSAPSFSNDVVDGLLDDPAVVAAYGEDNINYLRTLAGPDALANSRDVGGDQIPVGELETTSITNTFSWYVNNLLNIVSLSNYREGENLLVQDFDVSNSLAQDSTQVGATSTVQLQYVENEQLSQELQFNFEGDRWRGIVGLYYFDETQKAVVPIGTNPQVTFSGVGNSVDSLFSDSLADGAPLAALAPESRVVIPGRMNIEAYAVFANFTFDITDTFRAKVGARQSEEERDIIVETRLPGPGFTLGTDSDPDPNRNGTIAQLPIQDERSYSSFTPEFGLEFDVGESLVYFTYSQGFKSGVAALVDTTPLLIAPEEITSYDLGVKGTYLDGTLNLSAAAFLYDIDAVQYDRTSLTSAGPRFSTSVENAGTTSGQGIEVEGAWQAFDNFRLDFNGTWYDIEFDEFDTTNPLDPQSALQGLSGQTVDRVNLAGNRPRNTPEYSLGLRGTFGQELGNGGAVDYSVAYAYKGDQYFTEFNDDRMSSDAYGIFDANIKFTFPNDQLTINLWGKNLTDEFVQSGAFAISTSRAITATYLPPRTYGVTVGYDF